MEDLKPMLEAFIELQVERDRKAAELQVERDRKAAELQVERDRKAAENMATLNYKIDNLAKELAEIKKNTVIIKGVVLSHFPDVSPKAKERLETTGESSKVGINEKVHTEFKDFWSNLASGARTKFDSGHKLKAIITPIYPEVTKGQLSQCGRFVNESMRQICNFNFEGRYPKEYHEFIQWVAFYWLFEKRHNLSVPQGNQ